MDLFARPAEAQWLVDAGLDRNPHPFYRPRDRRLCCMARASHRMDQGFHADRCRYLFLLSVSEVFIQQRRRIAFVCFISAAALLYLTALRFHYRAPWFYVSLLLISIGYGAVQAIRFYGWKSPYLYSLFLLLPYGAWAIQRALQGTLRHGLNFYLFGLFFVTGLVYFRHFRRFTPGSAPDLRLRSWCGAAFSLCRPSWPCMVPGLAQEVSFGTCQSFSWPLE